MTVPGGRIRRLRGCSVFRSAKAHPFAERKTFKPGVKRPRKSQSAPTARLDRPGVGGRLGMGIRNHGVPRPRAARISVAAGGLAMNYPLERCTLQFSFRTSFSLWYSMSLARGMFECEHLACRPG